MTAYEPCRSESNFGKDISQAFTCIPEINNLTNSKNIWSSLYNIIYHANGSQPNVAMHKDWSLQCHFLVLKSGPPFLTVVKRGRFSNLHYD